MIKPQQDVISSAMKALVYKNSELIQKDIEKPRPSDGEALVRILLSGICNTDLEIMKGYMGFEGVPGHEFVGVIEEAEDESLVGKRVAGEINIGCGDCDLCRAGDPRHCKNRDTLGIFKKNGALAEYITLPEANLFVLPDKISDEHATLIEPLAAAFQITEQIDFPRNAHVLITGDGKLGILTALALKSTGLHVSLYGHHFERNLAFLDTDELVKSENDLKQREKFDYAVEASGSPDGFNLALDMLNPLGTLILKSTFASGTKIDAARIVIDEISVIGSRCGRFHNAVNALETGKVKIPDGFIEATYSMNDYRKAFDHARKKGTLKVLLKP